MDLIRSMFEAVAALESAGIESALCGGLALAVHGCPRATQDIDLLLLEADLERAREVLANAGFHLESGHLPFDAGLPTARRVFRLGRVEGEDLLTLDLLLVGEVFRPAWDSRQRMRIGDRELHVVSREGLTAMKRLAGRPQDLADIAALDAMRGDQEHTP